MANKYSRSVLRPMASQYVDDQSVNVAKVLRERYDKGLEKKTLLEQAMGAMQVGDGDQYLLNNAKNEISNQLAKHANAGDWENSGATIDAATTTLVSNKGVQLAQRSYQNREKELEDIAKLRLEKGVSHVLDFNAIYDDQGNVVGHKFDNHQSYVEDENGNMVSNIYRADSQVQLDYDAKKQSVLKGIAKDGTALTPSQILGKLEKWTGVTRARAEGTAEELVDSYINGTDEGRQEKRALMELQGYTEEEAEEAIVESMKAVARKQMGGVPTYMDQANAESSNVNPYGDTQTTPGQSAIDNNLDPIEAHNTAYGNLIESYRQETDPAKKQSLLLELNAAEVRRNKLIRLTMQGGDQDTNLKVREDLWSTGNNDKFSILENLLMETAKGTWGRDAGNDMIDAVQKLDGKSTTHRPSYSRAFSNVRDLFAGEKAERLNMQNQFSNIDAINANFGTDYNDGDIEDLRKLAGQYYDFMTGTGQYKDVANGDAFYDAYEKTPIKTTDVIAFNYEGEANAKKVDGNLKRMTMDQFNFISNTGEVMSADEFAAMKKEIGTSNFTFAGLVLPDIFAGTPGSMVMKVGENSYRAIPKGDNGGSLGVMSNIASAMGLQIYDANANAYNEAAAGDITLGQYHTKKLDAMGMNIARRLNPDMAAALQESPATFDPTKWNLSKSDLQFMSSLQTAALQTENLVFSGVGRLMKIGNPNTLRMIENDESHPRHQEFTEALAKYNAQQFKITDY